MTIKCLFFSIGLSLCKNISNIINYSALCLASIGIRQIVLIALKMNPWICNDVVMDILPFFEHVELGLKLALISDRFNGLVKAHFDGKSELTIWRRIAIHKDNVAVPELAVFIDSINSVPFPLPDHSLPTKIRFCNLRIDYIDHSVIAFLHSNKHIWDRSGTKLDLYIGNNYSRQIWDVLARQLWPIIAPNIRHLCFNDGRDLDDLLRRTSPTILTDLDQLNSIHSGYLFPAVIAADHVDGSNAIPIVGQALSKWLHTPTKDGQPKRLDCFLKPPHFEWVINFKEIFLNATTSVSYEIQFIVHPKLTQIVPFELANERTKEKLTLIKPSEDKWDERWIMKRCRIGETATAIQWEDENLNNVNILLVGVTCIGPLSPPEEEAGQSSEKGASSDE